MPVSSRPARRFPTRTVAATAAALLAVGLVAVPATVSAAPVLPPASTAPATTAPATTAPASTAPAAAKPAASRAVAPPATVDGVAARVTGGHRVTVTWSPPTDRALARTGVTVCRVDAAVSGVLSARTCRSATAASWAAGRLDDTTVVPGRTYSYAVLPSPAEVTAASTSATAVPVVVTVPRAARSETPTRLAAAGSGSVAGTVRTAAGAAVPGATALLIGYEYPQGYVVRGQAVTAADGTYRITGLGNPGPDSDTAALCIDAGTSSVRPSGGLVDTCWRSSAWDGIVADLPFDADRVGVRDGVALTGVDVALATGATVTGRVTAGGVGIADADVVALGASQSRFRVRSGADGRFTFTGISAASVTLCVDAQRATVPAGSAGYAAQCYDAQPWNGDIVPPAARSLPLAAGSVRNVGVIALGPAAGAAGLVTAAGGAPLAGVRVYVLPFGDDPLAPVNGGGGLAYTGGEGLTPNAVTGTDGRWSAPGLAPGRYTVCYDAATTTGGPSATGYRSVCTGGVAFLPYYDSRPANAGTIGLTRGSVTRSNIVLPAAGGLTGTVRDASGTALAGVEVQVLVTISTLSSTTVGATTDAAGHWTVDGLTPGATVVCFEASRATGATAPRGYADQCSGGVAWNGVQGIPPGAQPVAVTAGQRTAVNATLTTGAAATGVVTSAAGAVAGAGVSVWIPGGAELPQSAVTGSDGSFTVRGLPTGRVVVCVDPDATRATPSGLGARCYAGVAWNTDYGTPAGAKVFTTTVGATTRLGTLTLPAGATVSGRVTAADGSPLTGVFVQAYDGSQSAQNATTTGADGRYTLTGVVASNVRVCFATRNALVLGGPSTTGYASECWNDVAWNDYPVPDSATTIAVPAGGAVTGIDAQLAAAGGLAGTVTTAGTTARLPGVGIVVFDADGHQAAYTETALDGTYRVTGLPVAAGYRVCAYGIRAVAPGGGQPTCAASAVWSGRQGDVLPAAATAFAVPAGTVVTGADIAVRPGGSIAGALTTDAGVQVSDSAVDVFDAAANTVGRTFTSADGTYRVPGLPAGTYRVCFEGTSSPATTATGLRPECAGDAAWSGNPGDGPAAGSTAVAVQIGVATTGVDGSLAPGGALAGVVSAGSGTGVPSTEVDVFTAADRTLLGRTYTAENGSWRATGLAAGRYLVCARANDYAVPPPGVLARCARTAAWDGSSAPPAAATVFTVTTSATTTASFALPAAAGIAGMVTGAGGSAIVGGYVTVFRGSQQVGYATTGSDGRYVVGGLAAGSYRVCVTAEDLGPRGGGYLPTCAGRVAWDGQGPPPAGATSYALTLGAIGGPADVTMPDGAAIRGTVKDGTSGAGLSSVSITVYRSPGGDYVRSTSTASDGTWTAAGLTAGTYAVCADPRFASGGSSTAGYLSRCWRTAAYDGYGLPPTATAVTVATGAVVSGIAISLPRAAGLSGRVTADGTGAPLAGVLVHLFTTRSDDVAGFITTAADGTWTARNLPVASLAVCFDGANATTAGAPVAVFGECRVDVRWQQFSAVPRGVTRVTTVASQVLTGIDAGLAPSASVQGRVTAADGTTPLPNAYVSVLSLPDGNSVGYAPTSPDGTYSLGGLDPGRYAVCVDGGQAGGDGSGTGAGYRNQCYRNVAWAADTSPPVDQATPVATTAGNATTGIDFALDPAAQVTGTVTDADGNGLDQVRVSVVAGGVEVAAGYAYGGSYTVRGLAPGSYQVCFGGADASGPGGSGYVSECADDQPWPDGQFGEGIPAGARTFALTAGSVTTVDASLAAAARLSGVVRDDASGGSGIGYPALAVFAAGGDQPLLTTVGEFDGSWSVGGLPAGQYRVCVYPGSGDGGYVGQCYDHVDWGGSAPPSTATPVAVTAGSTVDGVDFDLRRA